MIVGRSLERELTGVEIGDELIFYSNRWTVVGVFDTGGAVSESQLITDAATPEVPTLQLFAAGEVLWMIVAADQAVVEEAIETLRKVVDSYRL